MKENRMVSVLSPKDGFTGLIAKKTGRNEVCHCGSGKKAKKCCAIYTKYYSRQPCDSKTSVGFTESNNVMKKGAIACAIEVKNSKNKYEPF